MAAETDKIPSHAEIEKKARDFLALLEQREVGLISYLDLRRKTAEELYAMLGKVLGKS